MQSRGHLPVYSHKFLNTKCPNLHKHEMKLVVLNDIKTNGCMWRGQVV